MGPVTFCDRLLTVLLWCRHIATVTTARDHGSIGCVMPKRQILQICSLSLHFHIFEPSFFLFNVRGALEKVI